MDSELNEDGKQNIEIEDIAEWSFSRELLYGLRQTISVQSSSIHRNSFDLGSRNAQEAHGHQHTSDCDLVVSKLDAVEVLNAQTVGRNQAVESQDLIHLDRGDQSATTLSDNGRDCIVGN